jgi:hypothetical protein
MGYYKADDRAHGLPELLAQMRDHLSRIGSPDFGMVLEHSWDYEAIDVTNKVGATSCWFDIFRSFSSRYLREGRIDSQIMRMLNSGRDFELSRSPTIYIENHDHERVIRTAGGRQVWWRTQPYIIALFTCPGAVLIYNGQEFGEDYTMPEPGTPGEGERVQSRPLHWEYMNDEPGRRLYGLYKQLIGLRKEHAGLRSGNFYPADWDGRQQTLGDDGFGCDIARQIVIYHRWGTADDGRLERFYIVLNFSDSARQVEVQLPEDDGWEDLLTGWKPEVRNHTLQFEVGSNWGHIFYKKS